jgi:Protein of unknown function (DUF4089)
LSSRPVFLLERELRDIDDFAAENTFGAFDQDRCHGQTLPVAFAWHREWHIVCGYGRVSYSGKRGSGVDGKQMDWESYIETSAKVLGLSLEPDWKPAIAANLETIFKIAAEVDAFELPDEAEPAPVFEA